MWCGRCAGHSGACLPRIPRCPFAVANLYTWKHECVIWVCYWIQTNGSISITLNVFLKKNTSISNFATDYQLQLCAPLGGLNILVRFNFRSLLNKISHPYMAKACKSYGGYKLFITLDQKTQVVPIGSMSKGELVHKIGILL